MLLADSLRRLKKNVVLNEEKILCKFVSEFQEKKLRHNAILTDRVFG